MNAITHHHCFPAIEATSNAFRLENEGFCIARQIVPPATIAAIGAELEGDFAATPLCCGPFYGERTKRFGRLLARSTEIATLAMHPTILALSRRILAPWCDSIQLNVTQAIEIQPGAIAQYPHRDQDMWRDAAGSHEYLVNVIWPLTAFTAENGATLLWPDTHGEQALHDPSGVAPVAAVAEPGDAIVFLGSTLHGAGANRSAGPRRGIVIGYSLGWLKPYENPWLAYPPEIARSFPRALAELAGYKQHRPNLGNFEGQCPSVLLDGRGGERLAATDALNPEQAAALARYVLEQQKPEPGRGEAMTPIGVGVRS